MKMFNRIVKMINRMFNINNVNYRFDNLEEIVDVINCSDMYEYRKESMIERLISEEVKKKEFIGIFRCVDNRWKMKSLGIGGWSKYDVEEGDVVYRLMDVNWDK